MYCIKYLDVKSILVAGGTGLVGKSFVKLLLEKGYKLHLLSRHPHKTLPTTIWDPENEYIELDTIPQVDAIVNLSGAGIADSRWTHKRKKSIVDSRVKSNKLVQKIIDNQTTAPGCYISASAIGIYGDRANEILKETSPISEEGFLAHTVKLWEDSIHEIKSPDTRKVILRFGMVLSPKGGVLEKLTGPVKFYLAPYFGNGKQYYSWIHIDDLSKMILYSIENKNLTGTFNACSTEAVTNIEMMKAILKARKTKGMLMPVPAFLLRLFMGEMSDIVLQSSRVYPENILQTGFQFEFDDIDTALKDLLT